MCCWTIYITYFQKNAMLHIKMKNACRPEFTFFKSIRQMHYAFILLLMHFILFARSNNIICNLLWWCSGPVIMRSCDFLGRSEIYILPRHYAYLYGSRDGVSFQPLSSGLKLSLLHKVCFLVIAKVKSAIVSVVLIKHNIQRWYYNIIYWW